MCTTAAHEGLAALLGAAREAGRVRMDEAGRVGGVRCMGGTDGLVCSARWCAARRGGTPRRRRHRHPCAERCRDRDTRRAGSVMEVVRRHRRARARRQLPRRGRRARRRGLAPGGATGESAVVGGVREEHHAGGRLGGAARSAPPAGRRCARRAGADGRAVHRRAHRSRSSGSRSPGWPRRIASCTPATTPRSVVWRAPGTGAMCCCSHTRSRPRRWRRAAPMAGRRQRSHARALGRCRRGPAPDWQQWLATRSVDPTDEARLAASQGTFRAKAGARARSVGGPVGRVRYLAALVWPSRAHLVARGRSRRQHLVRVLRAPWRRR